MFSFAITLSTTLLALLVLLVASSSFCSALPLGDEVPILPGYGPPPSRLFSGYIPDGPDGTSQLHYFWFFPAPSSGKDPATAPVISVATGGPGCSTALFLFTEAGPLLFDLYNVSSPANDTTAAPLRLNPYSWTQRGHLFGISQPAGVGLSYSTKSMAALDTDDHAAAQRYFFALKHLFLVKFPEFIPNALYFGGESFAGVFLPLWTDLIMDFRANVTAGLIPENEKNLFANLVGLGVGNGVTDHRFDDALLPTAIYGQGHALISARDFETVASACPVSAATDSDNCSALWDLFPFDVQGGMNIYDTTGYCYNPKTVKQRGAAAAAAASSSSSSSLLSPKFLGNIRQPQRPGLGPAAEAAADKLIKMPNVHRRREGSDVVFGPLGKTTITAAASAAELAAGADGVQYYQCPRYLDLTCTDEYWIDNYLQRRDVQAALHVPLGLHFSVCSNINYNKSVRSVVGIYAKIMKFNAAQKAQNKSQIAVVLYNGDSDLAVPYTGTWAWMEASGWMQTSEFRRWTYRDEQRPLWGEQLGGFSMTMDGGLPGSGGLVFATVRGASHMVPGSRPAAALELLDRLMQTSTGAVFNKDATPLSAPVLFKATPASASEAAAASGQAGDSLSTGASMGIGIAIGAAVAAIVAAAIILFARRRGNQKQQQHGSCGGGSGGEVALEASAADAATGYRASP